MDSDNGGFSLNDLRDLMRTRVLLLLLLTACATSAPPSPIPLDLARWHHFSWASVTVDGTRFDRAAILVVDSLSSRGSSEVLLQLDLAGSSTMPFGFPSTTAPNPARDRLHGLLHGHGPVTVAATSGEPESVPLTTIGSFGLPEFELSPLLLDFARQRIGILPPLRNLPPAIWSPERTTGVTYDSSRVRIPLLTGGHPLQVLFDTGLNPFPLWTTKAHWMRLTGRDGTEPDNRRHRLHHPAGTLTFVGSRSRLEIRIGGVSLGRLDVVFLDEGPAEAQLEAWPFAVDGVLGPSAFGDGLIVALDLRGPRMALLPSGSVR